MEAPCPAPILEICVDSVASASAAAAGGADRVELCANLPEGGTTPSAGLIRTVRSVFPGRLMILIRPRGYDFLYSQSEVDAMLHDIATARTLGADGVVIGCLTQEGQIDVARCRELVAAAAALDITFHRAFDMSRDLGQALEDVIGLGIRRILTSGGQPDVPQGRAMITDLVRRAGDRLSIMPGGGVTHENLAEIVRSTSVREIHLSARHVVRSAMLHRNENCGMGVHSQGHEYEWRETSAENVRLARQALLSSR
jgi:copper homeostasis protein